ncbi:MAG: hypothetical protein DCF28_00835 [Alphaproteobacteria bacterium]|nr:MAG: hypothetical protein DCF28_00835 [Alphaproteobacteria bacterium]PZO39151.1 MAG: hypothetical protein DCE92_04735 [Alphaproteobacteria bacterium]
MRLPTILKIVLTIFFALWVVGLYATMPPKGIWETIGVLVFAAALMVVAYYFNLFLIRAAMKAVSRKSGKD